MIKLPRFGSRKFFAFWFSVILFVLIPVLYQQIGVDVSIQLFVLGAVASVTLGYNISNVLESKWASIKESKDL